MHVINMTVMGHAMRYKSKRVYIYRGLNKGAWGTVIHEDKEALHLVTDDGEDIYDRKENAVLSQGHR